MEEIKEFIEAKAELRKVMLFVKHSNWLWLFMSLCWTVLALSIIGTLISDDFRIFVNELFGYGI